MFFLILVVLGITWALYRTFKDEFSPLRKIPYASSRVPILGHALVFLREKNHLKVLRDWSEKHGPIFRYNRGFGKLNQLQYSIILPTPRVFISCYENTGKKFTTCTIVVIL